MCKRTATRQGPSDNQRRGWDHQRFLSVSAPSLSSWPRPLAGGSSRSRTSRLALGCCAPASASAGTHTRWCATTNCCWRITACTCGAPLSGGACSRPWGRSRPRKTKAYGAAPAALAHRPAGSGYPPGTPEGKGRCLPRKEAGPARGGGYCEFNYKE